jgi:hypothetical protein
MRYWSLTRMLYCPFRSPLRASKWFPGGIRSDSRLTTAFNRSSFLLATSHNGSGHARRAALERTLLKMSSVPRSEKDWINAVSRVNRRFADTKHNG